MMNDYASTPESSLLAACALATLMLALILWRTAQGARARAQEKARAWAEIKRPDWDARALRRSARSASGARAEARLRGALMIAVSIVAVAATNLSAHATIRAMARVGLHSLDTAVSVIIVFEMFLAILGALSWWHMNRGSGFNRYELGVWSMAALMGGIAWWGGHNPIFALWPMLAAIAWHVVVTFGRNTEGSKLARWWRMRFGIATSNDATRVLTERYITILSRHGYAAHEGVRILRRARARMFKRAWMRADALGILTPEVRAQIQTRTAALYVGARALAPDAVAHMNPWNDAHAPKSAHARIVRTAPATRAHDIEVVTHVPDDARALTEDARASEPTRAPAPAVSAHAASDVLAAIASVSTVPEEVKVRMRAFVEANGGLPTQKWLAAATQRSPGHAGRWLTPVRKSLGY